VESRGEEHDDVCPAPTREITIAGLKGDPRPFIAEAFYNQHCLFLMLAPKARIKARRRVTVASR
jgi:hypothetical protein